MSNVVTHPPTGSLALPRNVRFSSQKLLLYGILLLVTLVYFVPLMVVLVRAFLTPTLSLDNFFAIAASSSLVRVIWVTILYAALASVLAVIITFPLAYVIANTKKTIIKRILLASIIVPILTSGLVRVFGWQVILDLNIIRFFTGGTTLLYTGFGVIIGLVHVVAPMVALTLVAGMNGQDRALASAAESMGAGKATLFTRVVFPLSLPAIEIAIIVGFVLSVGSFATPAILGGHGRWGSMIGSDVYRQIFNQGNYGSAAALTVILLVLTGIVLVVYRKLMGGRIEWLVNRSVGANAGKIKPAKKKVAPTKPRSGGSGVVATRRTGVATALANVADRYLPPGAFKAFSAVAATFTAVFLLAPEFFAMPVAFTEIRALTFPPVGFSMKWFEGFFTEKWLGPVRTSLLLSIIAAIVVPVIALVAAFVAERSRSAGLRSAVLFIMLAPALIPSITSAAGYHVTLTHLGLSGRFSMLSIALAAMALPFAYVVLSNAVRSFDPTYERAGYSMGASYGTVLRRIILPGIARPMVVASAIVFLMTLDEAVVSVFLSSFGLQTLSARMFTAVLDDGDPTIAVVAVIWIGGILILSLLAYLGRLALKATPFGRRSSRERA